MTATIAIVGDFQRKNPTHAMTNAALGHVGLSFDWIGTETIGDQPGSRLASYAGLWIAPASPYQSMEGALAAIRYARERGVPLVGT